MQAEKRHLGQTNPSNRHRILVVEDDALVAMDIEDALRDAGYDVVGVADRCGSAVQLAGTTHPDLVLMDLELAGSRTGLEAAALIHRQYGVPSLFLAARSVRELAIHAAAADAAGWLPKPVTRDRLRRAVADALA